MLELWELAKGALGTIAASIETLINDWNNLSDFEKAHTIGKVVGALILEIVLAFFTGGAGTMAKFTGRAGKVGKALMKVAKVGEKVRDKVKNVIPKKFRTKNGKGDYDDGDSKNLLRQLLLNQARVIAETMDAADNTIGELITTLNLTEKIYPKLGNVKWPFEHIKENIYAVGMIASPEKSVDKHFTSGKDNENKITLPSAEENINNRAKGKPTRIKDNDDFETTRGLLRENESANILAKKGFDVEQTPKIEGTAKRPDFLIEGKVFDNYAPSGKKPRNIADVIKGKVDSKQTERIVLNLKNSDVDIDLLTKQLTDYPIEGLKEIIIIDKNSRVINYYPF